jgi:hypothetical protein
MKFAPRRTLSLLNQAVSNPHEEMDFVTPADEVSKTTVRS